MKNIIKTSIFVTVILAIFVIAGVVSFTGSKNVLGSAPSGLPASIATTSLIAVTTTASSVFATSSCSARIITTVASPIMVTFSDYAGQTPTALFGHLQAASTTVAYDSGLYGCGLMKVYSFVASNITVSETR